LKTSILSLYSGGGTLSKGAAAAAVVNEKAELWHRRRGIGGGD